MNLWKILSSTSRTKYYNDIVKVIEKKKVVLKDLEKKKYDFFFRFVYFWFSNNIFNKICQIFFL